MGLRVDVVRSAREQEALAKFRYRVYVEELKLIAPEAADGERRQLRDPLDHVSISWAIFDRDEVIGSLRMTPMKAIKDLTSLVGKFDFESAIRLFGASAIVTTSRFIVDPRAKGGTAMLRMMTACFEEARRQGARLNYGDCSPGLLLFYEHMGYRRYVRPYNDPLYGFKLPIVMLFDQERLRIVGSPLYRVSLKYPRDQSVIDWFESTYREHVDNESAPFIDIGTFMSRVSAQLPGKLALGHIFEGLSDDDLQRLLAKASIFRVYPGDLVLRPGERAGALFLVLNGEMMIVVSQGNHASSRGVLTSGDFFGNVDEITLQPPNCEVQARSETLLLVAPMDHVKRFLAMRPSGPLLEKKLRTYVRSESSASFALPCGADEHAMALSRNCAPRCL